MNRSTAREKIEVDFSDDDFLKARQELVELCVAKLGMPRKTALQVSYLANRAFAELARSASGRRASPKVKKVKEEMTKRLAKGLSPEERRHFVRDVIDWADKKLNFSIRKTKVNELWNELEPNRPKQRRKGKTPVPASQVENHMTQAGDRSYCALNAADTLGAIWKGLQRPR